MSVQSSGPILVVDDDPGLRRALSRILRSEGHEVIEAADGPTALALSLERDPCLVVLDYAMPGMDGEMVVAAMRERPDASVPPIVLLTAGGKQQARARAMGAVESLCKPFQVEELLRAVSRHRRAYRPDA